MTSHTLRQTKTGTDIDLISTDLLHNIVTRLPARSFAYAACVSRSFNLVCERILSRPKLSSACSVNSSLQVGVKDVVDKVLAEPIRPHFAILSIGDSFDLEYNVEHALEEAHYLITEALGNHIPIITNSTLGTIGRDAFSDEFKETQWTRGDEDNAIILTVGFLPGMKVATIPVLMNSEAPLILLSGKFVKDIRGFSTSVSGCSSPAAIMLFGGKCHGGMTEVVEKMGYAMSRETVIVGDYSSEFRYSNSNHDWSVAVALVFAVESNKPPGVGETRFHAILSSGLSPVGLTYQAASVIEKNNSIWISARSETSGEYIDAETIRNQLGDRILTRKLYIGVTKKRKCSVGQEKVGYMKSVAYYEVRRNNRRFFFVTQKGVNIGDSFRFYYSDRATALSSVTAISSHMRSFNSGSNNTTGGEKQEVFGGLIFSCCGERFFGKRNIDSSPFLDNFPGVTLGGAFCSRVIGRGLLTPYVKESQEHKAVQCCLQARGAVYFIMSYSH